MNSNTNTSVFICTNKYYFTYSNTINFSFSKNITPICKFLFKFLCNFLCTSQCNSMLFYLSTITVLYSSSITGMLFVNVIDYARRS